MRGPGKGTLREADTRKEGDTSKEGDTIEKQETQKYRDTEGDGHRHGVPLWTLAPAFGP